MDALKNMATKLGSSSSGDKATGNNNANTQNQDYGDKAFEAGSKKFGLNLNRDTSEKITDTGREQFEKLTGKKVPEKFSN